MDFPKSVQINEEGPREGFQIEKGPIATERKIELIDALSQTGLKHIQIVSFVSPKAVPGMKDAEDVVRGITMKPGIAYTGLWLNEQGLERAIATGRLHNRGSIALNASTAFLKRNQNKTPEQQLEIQRNFIAMYQKHGIPIERAGIMAAFGCNYEGDVGADKILELVRTIVDLAAEHDITLKRFSLADSMAWATPLSVKRLVGAVRDRFPDLPLSLHLHDTRGMGVANAFAGLEMGVTSFDSAVGGLGGCPYAGHQGAAGNLCTDDLVFMCQEMGIETGVDLEALIECTRLAEDIVGHPLPSSVAKGGSLRRLRERVAARA